jgi:nucleotide-binding universal stress UspA family protein
MAAFKYLVIADDSPECPIALLYAALRARATGSGIVMLNVVEPASYQHWVSVGEAMRAEARENADALCQRYQAEIASESGIEAKILIREGEVRPEIRCVLAEDPAIKLLVLAAGVGRDGPGPLVASLAKGGLGGRTIPVLVVPGDLSRDDVRMLAGPGPA